MLSSNLSCQIEARLCSFSLLRLLNDYEYAWCKYSTCAKVCCSIVLNPVVLLRNPLTIESQQVFALQGYANVRGHDYFA